MKSKMCLFRFAFACGTIFASMVHHSASAETTVLFSPSPGVPEAIAAAIDSAVVSVDLAIYGMTDANLRKRLEEASKRGVRLRVILHEANRHESIANGFEQSGGDVRYVSLTMHHKFAVIDGKTLLTGSCNWTRSAFTRYDDDLLIFREQQDVTNAFANEFNFIWANAKEFGERRFVEFPRPATTDADVVFTSMNMTAITHDQQPTFRSSDVLPGVCGGRIIKEIQLAKKSIRVATTHFRRLDIQNELLNAIQRGVQVEMVLDQQECHSSTTKTPDTLYDEALALAGANVRYKCYSTKWEYQTALQMHAKFIVIDDRLLLTGSFNWSEASELAGFENLIMIRDREVTKKYVERFKLIHGYANVDFRELLDRVWRWDKPEPMTFAPVSLGCADVFAIRGVAANR